MSEHWELSWDVIVLMLMLNQYTGHRFGWFWVMSGLIAAGLKPAAEAAPRRLSAFSPPADVPVKARQRVGLLQNLVQPVEH